MKQRIYPPESVAAPSGAPTAGIEDFTTEDDLEEEDHDSVVPEIFGTSLSGPARRRAPKSALKINPYSCGDVEMGILGAETGIGHLPTEETFIFQVIKRAPMSMARYMWFVEKVHGQTFNWLNGQSIQYPRADRYKPSCLLPMADDTSEDKNYGAEVTFKKSDRGKLHERVYGIAEIPMFIGCIPIRLSCLLVDQLPMYKTEFTAPAPDILIHSSLLDGRILPIVFDDNTFYHRQNEPATITVDENPDTSNLTLKAYSDFIGGAPTLIRRRPHFGYGVWFKENSVFNTAGLIYEETGVCGPAVLIGSALRTLYQIRDLCTFHFSSLDFTDVTIYCSSPELVGRLTDWSKHWKEPGWIDGQEQVVKQIKDLMLDVMRTQATIKKLITWEYIEREQNQNATNLARSVKEGIPEPNWIKLANDYQSHLQRRKALEAGGRPSKYLEALSLEGVLFPEPRIGGKYAPLTHQVARDKEDEKAQSKRPS